MANMSYCRFHNTRIDLRDCIDALEYGDISSEEEVENCVEMFSSIISYLEDEGIVECDDDAFDEWVERVKEMSEGW